MFLKELLYIGTFFRDFILTFELFDEILWLTIKSKKEIKNFFLKF